MSEIRCVFCRDSDLPMKSCHSCHTAVHAECVAEHGGCPTCGLNKPIKYSVSVTTEEIVAYTRKHVVRKPYRKRPERKAVYSRAYEPPSYFSDMDDLDWAVTIGLGMSLVGVLGILLFS